MIAPASRNPTARGTGRSYQTHDWWSDDGWAWLQKRGVTEPVYWQDRRWNAPNQPVVSVSFWEAQACCRWAGGRLPNEREWEAAARGPDGYRYPWGDDWEDGICNSNEAGLGVTSPVGLFPRSRQVRLGIEDLAGNCWEWCDDFYDGDQREGGSPRVLRGGAFDDPAWFLRSSDRDWDVSGFRGQYFGFRCVLAEPRQP
jgi:formylglycine-generating enzyme required for sulfatase activity